MIRPINQNLRFPSVINDTNEKSMITLYIVFSQRTNHSKSSMVLPKYNKLAIVLLISVYKTAEHYHFS